MKTMTLILAGGAALLSIPALAAMGAGGAGHHAGHGGHGGPGMPMMMGMDPSKPTARADVESMVKAHFAKLDTNTDGFLVKEEVAAAHQAMKAERRDAHFKEMDSDGNGSISRAEFDARVAARPAGEPEDGPEGHGAMQSGHKSMGGGMRGGMGERMFTRADANQDGRVSLAEALAKPLQHFDQVDSNKDGVLSPAERESAHQAMRAKRKGAED